MKCPFCNHEVELSLVSQETKPFDIKTFDRSKTRESLSDLSDDSQSLKKDKIPDTLFR